MTWVKIRNYTVAPGGREHRYGHASCAENYNEAIDCGIDRGDCGDAACCFSASYDVEQSNAAHDLRVGEKP